MVRFGDGTVPAVPVFGSGSVPLQKGLCCVSVELNRKGRFRFRFLENGSSGSGSAVGFGKTFPTVPVSVPVPGSGSVSGLP